MFQDVTRDSKQPLFLFLFKMQYTELAVEEDANLASTQSLVFTSFFFCLFVTCKAVFDFAPRGVLFTIFQICH